MADSAARSEPAGSRFRSGSPMASDLPAGGLQGAARRLRHRRHAPALLGSLLLLAHPTPVAAQAASSLSQPLGISSQDRQLFGNGSGTGSGVGPAGSSSGIDINNPIDLINRIRRSTALDDATPPASAVDQALKALEAQSGPAPAGSVAPGRQSVSPAASGMRPAASVPAPHPGSP